MNSQLYPWQHKLWQQFAENLPAMPHAIMLTGQVGTGKTAFARKLAQLLLCPSPRKEQDSLFPCESCKSCSLFAAQTHLDFLPLGGEERILLAQVHRLREFLQLTAHFGAAKVAVMSDAEAMNPSAANALLKILEEPPPSKFIILVTSVPERLPATVRSRCVSVRMPTLNDAELSDWLRGLPEPVQPDQFLCEFCSNAPLAAHALLTSERGQHLKQLNQSLDAFNKGEIGPLKFSALCLAAIAKKTSVLHSLDPLDLLIWRLEQMFIEDKKNCSPRLYGLHKILLARRRLLLTGINLNKELLYEECALLWQAAGQPA